MKKIKTVAFAMLAIMVVAVGSVALFGCGTTTAEGKWDAVVFQVGKTDYINQITADGGIVNFEFKDGKVTATNETMGEDSTINIGTYTQDGDKVTLDIGGTKIPATLKDNKMVFEGEQDGKKVTIELVK